MDATVIATAFRAEKTDGLKSPQILYPMVHQSLKPVALQSVRLPVPESMTSVKAKEAELACV